MTGAEIVHDRTRLLSLTEQLVSEYGDRLAAGTVIRTVLQARNELRRAGVRAGLVTAVEAMSRHRLRQRLAAA